MAKTKACVGIDKVYFAPKRADGGYETPVRILHAKKLESQFNYENIQEWADNIAVINEFLYGGGEGTLSVLGLTPEEQILLFGNQKAKGGLFVTDTDSAPEGAFLFERRKVGGAKRLYVIYSCKCSPIDISAETIEEGKGTYEVNEINFSIGSHEKDNKNYVYFYIDTDSQNVVADQITKWYTEVQFPDTTTFFNEGIGLKK